jgi:hypothetical protein
MKFPCYFFNVFGGRVREISRIFFLGVNLLEMLEHEDEAQDIRNTPEVKRRAKSLEQAAAVATKTLRLVQQITQLSIKFIRCVSYPALARHTLAASLCDIGLPLRQVKSGELWTPLVL